MEEIRDELKKLSEAAPKGSHKLIAKEVGYSEQYLQQIRDGKNLKTDTPENRALIQNFINAYRRIIRQQVKELNEVL